MKFDGIIFDFNGTMFLDTELNRAAWLKYISELGEMTTEEAEKIYKSMDSHQNRTFVKELLKKFNISNDDPSFIKKCWMTKEQYYLDLVEETKLNTYTPGLVKLLDELQRRNIPFNISSMATEMLFDYYFDKLNLDKWFDRNKIVYDDDKTYPDTKSLMFIDSAKNIDLDIKNCLVFEDSIHSIEEAIKAGCKAVIVIDNPKNKNYTNPKLIKRIKDFNEFDLNEYFD